MEIRDECKQLGDWVDSANKQMQDQLNNIGHINMTISTFVSLCAAVGISVVLNILILWIPTSFILWLLLCIFPIIRMPWSCRPSKRNALFRKYRSFTNKQKSLGQETGGKRLALLAMAYSAIYLVTIVVLILAKAGVLTSTSDFSIWMPIVTAVLLTVYTLCGPTLFRRFKISNLNWLLNLNKTKLQSAHLTRSRLLVFIIFVVLLCLISVFVLIILPVWSLKTTWVLYSDVNGFKVFLLLILQALSVVLLLGSFSLLSARTHISNNIANLSNLKLRIVQLLDSSEISEREIISLKKQYYEIIKYRFIHQRLFGVIPVYMPVLNEAYVEADIPS